MMLKVLLAAGLETAKRALREAVILPALNPEVSSEMKRPKMWLFFGARGNLGYEKIQDTISIRFFCNTCDTG